MKLIEQSYKIIDPKKDILENIEEAGRTCYKSEGKIEPGSAAKFVNMINKRGHYSVLEHGHLAFKVPLVTLKQIKQIQDIPRPLTTPALDDGYITMSKYKYPIASANLRAWKEFLEIPRILQWSGIRAIAYALHKRFPNLFPMIMSSVKNAHFIEPSEMGTNEKILHTTRTVRFITNRGTTHDIVRHRQTGISQESTRFIKYGNDMEFIRPVWLDKKYLGTWSEGMIIPVQMNESDRDAMSFLAALAHAKHTYTNLIKKSGWQPQQAREVLPNNLKAEIVMTTTLRQWYHIFKLRCSTAAHPQVRALMIPLAKEMSEETGIDLTPKD